MATVKKKQVNTSLAAKKPARKASATAAKAAVAVKRTSLKKPAVKKVKTSAPRKIEAAKDIERFKSAPLTQKEIIGKQFSLNLMIAEVIRSIEMDRGTPMQFQECADYFGVARTTYANVVSGHVYLPNCKRQTIEAFAKGLGIPVIQVYLLCGFFKPSDHLYEIDLEQNLETAYRTVVAQSTDFMMETPAYPIWNEWPLTAKLYFFLMFQRASQKTVLKQAMAVLPELAKYQKVVQKA